MKLLVQTLLLPLFLIGCGSDKKEPEISDSSYEIIGPQSAYAGEKVELALSASSKESFTFDFSQTAGPEVNNIEFDGNDISFMLPLSYEDYKTSFSTIFNPGEVGATEVVFDLTVNKNLPPTVVIKGANQAIEFTQVQLSGKQSLDPEGGHISLAWEVTNGDFELQELESEVVFTVPSVSKQAEVSVKLTASDEYGQQSYVEHVISITPSKNSVYQLEKPYLAGESFHTLGINDVNGDGIDELITTDSFGSQLNIVYFEGESFRVKSLDTNLNHVSIVAFVDYNEDAELDILMASRDGFDIYINQGDFDFKKGVNLSTYWTSSSWKDDLLNRGRVTKLFVDDINNDGIFDITYDVEWEQSPDNRLCFGSLNTVFQTCYPNTSFYSLSTGTPYYEQPKEITSGFRWVNDNWGDWGGTDSSIYGTVINKESLSTNFVVLQERHSGYDLKQNLLVLDESLNIVKEIERERSFMDSTSSVHFVKLLDIDRDGDKDIIFNSERDQTLWLENSKEGWLDPKVLFEEYFQPIAMLDINNDDSSELFGFREYDYQAEKLFVSKLTGTEFEEPKFFTNLPEKNMKFFGAFTNAQAIEGVTSDNKMFTFSQAAEYEENIIFETRNGNEQHIVDALIVPKNSLSDVVTVDSLGTLKYFTQTSLGIFTPEVLWSSKEDSTLVLLGATANDSQEGVYFYYDGEIRNGRGESIVSNVAEPSLIKISDMDGNGFADVIYVDEQSDRLTIKFDEGTTFSDLTLPSTGSVSTLSVGDVNKDGLMDILYGSFSKSLLIQKENREFQKRDIYHYSAMPTIMGDFNGDGKSEIIFQKNALEAYSIESFEKQSVWLGGGIDVAWLASADVNGDGADDLLLNEFCKLEEEYKLSWAKNVDDKNSLDLIHYQNCLQISENNIEDLDGNDLFDVVIDRYCDKTGPIIFKQTSVNVFNKERPSEQCHPLSLIRVGDMDGNGSLDTLILNKNRDKLIQYLR